MKKRLSLSIFSKLFLPTIYSLLLISLYKLELSSYWGYMGFVWDPSFQKGSMAVVFIILISSLIREEVSTRNTLLTFCLYFHTIPSFVFFSISNQDYEYGFLVLLSNLVLVFISNKKVKTIKVPKTKWKHVLILSSVLSFLTLMQIILSLGFSSFNLDFGEVYEIRAQTEDKLSGVFGYLRPLVTKVLIPISLITAIVTKSKLFIIITTVQIVLYFGLTQHKVILFSSLLIVLVYFSLNWFETNKVIGMGMIFLLLICVLDSFMNQFINDVHQYSRISSIVGRRSLFVPPLLDSYHYITFLTEEYYYWSQSKITFGLIEKPHQLNAPFLVGLNHFGNESMSANTGFIGSGFANAGTIGVMLYSVLIGLVVSLLNTFGNARGHILIVSTSLTLFLGALRGSDLTSIFLTHGLLLLIIIFSFLPKHPPVLK